MSLASTVLTLTKSFAAASWLLAPAPTSRASRASASVSAPGPAAARCGAAVSGRGPARGRARLGPRPLEDLRRPAQRLAGGGPAPSPALHPGEGQERTALLQRQPEVREEPYGLLQSGDGRLRLPARRQGQAPGPVQGGEHPRPVEAPGDGGDAVEEADGLGGGVGRDERLGEFAVPAQDRRVHHLLRLLQSGDPAQRGDGLRGVAGGEFDGAEGVQAAGEEHLVVFLLGGADAPARVAGGAGEAAGGGLGGRGHVPGRTG
ncbi:hypothetical protein M4D82_03615 [Streptomyces sp. RerS4]|nr:hypothetical protein M4D82_03615 [Streptomyces sp. RerS4]